MTSMTRRVDELREEALRQIKELRLAGENTRHSRADNLAAVQGLVQGNPHNTFGIHGVENIGFEEALACVSSVTKCSSDPEVVSGGGYISPSETLEGLEAAARRIAPVARRGGRFLLGTGHPGSLLDYYIRLGEVIRGWGGEVLTPAAGEQVPPGLDIDYIEGVAVTTDRASLMHTHDFRAMELMLAAAPSVDFAVVDHGYAGAAINAGIPLVVIMDTNDPAFAVAQRNGADVTIVPMDDNRPLSAYLPMVELVRAFGDLDTGPA